MAATSALPSELATQDESTPGTDPGSWDSAGQPFYHRQGLDVSPIKVEMVEDDRNVGYGDDYHAKLHGKPSGQFSFAVPLHGTETETSATAQVTATELGNLLQHCMGASSRSYSSALSGTHSTTTCAPVTTTGIDEGVMVAIRRDSASGTELYVREVASWDGTTITFDQALSFTPTDSDTLHGCEVGFRDLPQLRSAVDSATTRAYRIQLGSSGAKRCWVLLGCRTELSGITIASDGAPWLEFTIHYTNFSGPDVESAVTFANSVTGIAPDVVGLTGECWIEDFGTTTNTTVGVNAVEVTPGMPVTMIPGVVPVNSGMPGVLDYSTERAETTMSLTLKEYASSYVDDFQADTLKAIRLTNLGVAGKCWAIHIPRCQIVEHPERIEVGPVDGVRLMIRAMPRASNSSASDADLWRSKIKIIRA